MQRILRAFTSLSTRLLLLTLLWVSFIVVSVGYTMLLNWELEASAATVRTVGELRHHAYRCGFLAHDDASRADLRSEIDAFNIEMNRLLTGSEWRLPRSPEIEAHLHELEASWRRDIMPLLLADAGEENRLSQVNLYVERLSVFSNQVEERRNDYLSQLQTIQWLVIVLAVGSLFVIMVLLVKWVIHPLEILGRGIFLLSNGRLSQRLPMHGEDEINLIGVGFNHMADRLQDLYNNLERKVADKTEALEVQNRQLEDLYGATSFLSHQRTMNETLDGFVERTKRALDADAAALFLRREEEPALRLEATSGVESDIVAELEGVKDGSNFLEQCLARGETIRIPLRFVESRRMITALRMKGYETVYCVPVRGTNAQLGVLALLYRSPLTLGIPRVQLLESLVTHLSVAIENGQLNERERLYAVVQERQLMARGLHDSIAQALSYLNLQVQFLSSAIEKKDDALRDESLAAIRTGLQECYDDVRELLLNFRERVHKEKFIDGVRTVINRFEAQANVEASLRVVERGPELTERQKVQVIFIIQEALSNVRKHAHASHVNVVVENYEDLRVVVEDDGVGIDEKLVESRKGRHVGLSIMSERASRIGAEVTVERASDEGGTRVVLFLAAKDR